MKGDSSVSSGSRVLDGMLGGGYPVNRPTLLIGGPGTGKSTLSMQFLQAGLDAGEECLYISTEQTIDELRQSFSEFSFQLEHDGLSVTSIHAGTGKTIESGEEELTLQTLDEDDDSAEILSEGFSLPFTAEYVREYIEQFGPVDRVVLDSVSGLSVIADNAQRFRRSVLDLIRLFSDEFGATSLFTAEQSSDKTTDALQFTTHGVIELARRPIDNDPHNFLQITKMRGVDYDRREMEVEFTTDGLRLAPERRSQPPELKDHAHTPVGIDGLDALTGGGLARGAGVLLKHDGRANLNVFFSALLRHGLEADERVILVPTIELRESRTERLLSGHGYDVGDLLDSGRLSVVDLVGTWDENQPGVFAPDHDPQAVMDVLGRLHDDTDGTTYSLVNGNAVVHTLGAAATRRLRYFEEAQLLDPESALLELLNPNTVSDELAGFYHGSVEQVLDTWIDDAGRQYVALRKSPCGFVGTTSLVEYIDDPPYVRVQHPPQTRENPYAEANPYAAETDDE